MTYHTDQVAFVDIETTGLDPDFDAPWEIAVIVDGNHHVWFQGVDLADVDPWVLENTGIVDRYDPNLAMLPRDSIARFNELVADRHLVGACPWFDSERLHRIHRHYADDDRTARQHPWHYHLIDVEALAVGHLAATLNWFGFELPLPWKSEDLSRTLGVDPAEFEPKHSALADARWAKAMFEAIVGPPE